MNLKNKEILKDVINYLENLSKRDDIEELEISITPDMVSEFKLLGEGKSYAYRNIDINITYKDLYVKDINNTFGCWELYNKEK